MNIESLMAILLSIGAFATSCAAQTTSSGGASSSGSGTTGVAAAGVMTGENSYCQAGAGVEKSEGTPIWGANDGVAEMPTRCMNTALASTPSPGSTVVASDTGGLTAALSSVACGQTIQLTAGQTYSGTFTFPNLSCDGAHWITVKTSGTIPAEGTRITPCYANIASESGYPSYSCASPSAQTAKITTTDAKGGVQFASGANHYRFVGIEITKQTDTKLSSLISLPPDGDTMGVNHVIFDRCVIHGQPWTLASGTGAETGKGIDANNSQYVALINSWNYDTYCNGGCTDSQGFASSTGLYASGPFKLYNNVIASAGETWMFGGGGKGIGTPNTDNIEIRANHSFKPLVWMIPIETGNVYNNTVVKNLGEFKAGTHVLIEGNVFENNWQGQSDQTGFALLLDPRNQNNKAAINVDFDGSTTVTKVGGLGNFIHTCGNDPNCRPDDAANCPPGGCILEIHDVARPDYNVAYRFCNGQNGCMQTGDLATTASLTQAPAAGTDVSTYSCVPGDCPSCRVNNVVVRYNEIYNTTMGLEINTALSSHCKDEAKELAKVEIRDNVLHGLSVEMSNGSDPYTYSSAFVLGNGQIGSIINNVDIGHNTVAIETGAETSGTASMGGLGQQVDYTDVQYLQGFNIHDNVAPAAWHVNHTNGSIVTAGVGGNSGLANVYQTDSCKGYYPVDGSGVVVSGIASAPVAAHSAFTFSPALGNYMVTKNGSNAVLDASTNSSFTLTGSLAIGDAITVRDLNTCNWKFMGNILATGMAGNLHVKDQSPYPTNKDSQNYILDAATFMSIFANWQDRAGENFTITIPAYQGGASDAAGRPASGKNAGVDLATWNSMVANVRTAVAHPALSITTATLPAATHGITYQAVLAASAGASPHKSWWLETDATKCGGNCGSLGGSGLIIGRSGVVNGPFVVLTVSRAGNVSTFTPKQTMVAGTWQVGQTITLAGFTNGTGNQANDSTFNGACTITAVATNNFSCAQSGMDIASHTANSASTVSFAPITPGTYTFWMGVRDGAFQQARAAVTATVN